MNEDAKRQVIEELRDDANYYGELGKRYLSNSDIKTLVSEPDLYGQPIEGINLVKGGYMHLRILEPHLIGNYEIVDCPTRRNKEYTDFVNDRVVEGEPKPIFLLRKEANELEALATKVESNDEFVDALQRDIEPNEIEEPMIGEIEGYWFKGKADRINRRRGFIADLKTTRSLSLFKKNIEAYGYHSQAYIYEKLFGLPVRFYVIDKETGRLGVYDMSEYRMEQAEKYVKWGLEKLEMYYGADGQENLEQYYEYMVL